MSEPHIVFASPAHPSRNPRLVRNAGILALSGYRVTVITPDYHKDAQEEDSRLAEIYGWSHHSVECHGGHFPHLRWFIIRGVKRVCISFSHFIPSTSVASRASVYGYAAWKSAVIACPADLYIGQQQASLPVIIEASRRHQARCACDIEDILSESGEDTSQAARQLEQNALHKTTWGMTMSQAASQWLQDRYALPELPMVLHNVNWAAESAAVSPPGQRPTADTLRLYWFGATLGPHSCGEQILQAIAHSGKDIRLTMRGKSRPDYRSKLTRLSQSLGIPDALRIEESCPAEEMVARAAEHDLLIGSQPSSLPFHQLAIGNKVFTGLAAGLGLILSDTEAHRRLPLEIRKCARLVRFDQIDQTAKVLGEIQDHRCDLEKMKENAWDLAQTRFHWEQESRSLLCRVKKLIGKPEN